MMRSKLMIVWAALVAVFTLSSCLGEDDSSSYPSYERIVTVGTGASRLYADHGEILLPKNTVTGLEKVQRAIVAFNVLPLELNGAELEPGKTYDVELDPNYCFSVPTSKVIDLNENAVAKDSLVNTQDPVLNVEGLYVMGGYLTATVAYSCRQFTPCYLDLAYDSETDVNLDTNTITFTLYFDNKRMTTTTQIKYPYSFRLPVEAYYNFQTDEPINVVLRYMVGTSDYRELKTTMTRNDFFLPTY